MRLAAGDGWDFIVLRVFQIIVTQPGGQLERFGYLIRIIAIHAGAGEVRHDGLVRRYQALDERMGFDVAGLISRPQHEALRGGLKDLLEFGGVSGQVAGVRDLCRGLAHAHNLTGGETLGCH